MWHSPVGERDGTGHLALAPSGTDEVHALLGEQVGDRRPGKKILDGCGDARPPVVGRARVRPAALRPADEAPALADGFKGRHHTSERDALGPLGQLKAALGAPLGAQDTRTGEGMERFREVVAGAPQRRSDLIHAHRTLLGVAGDMDYGANGVLGGAGEPHRDGNSGQVLANIMTI